MTPSMAIILFVVAALIAVVIILLLQMLKIQQSGGSSSEAESLERYILIDPETGIYNRSFMQKKIDEEIYRSARYDTNFAIILLDFTPLLQKIPHEKAMTTFRKICSALARDTRFTDVVARIDDFRAAVLLSMTPKRSAEIPLNRFLNKTKTILRNDGIEGEPVHEVLGFPEDKAKIESLSSELKRS